MHGCRLHTLGSPPVQATALLCFPHVTGTILKLDTVPVNFFSSPFPCMQPGYAICAHATYTSVCGLNVLLPVNSVKVV